MYYANELKNSCERRIMEFLRRQSILPFETCFGFICIYSGFAGLLGYSAGSYAFRQTFGFKISLFFNITYLVGGIGLFFGLGFARRNLEAAGLIMIVMSLIVRLIIFHYLDVATMVLINNYAFSIAFIISSIVRAASLINRKVIVEVNEFRTEDPSK